MHREVGQVWAGPNALEAGLRDQGVLGESLEGKGLLESFFKALVCGWN